MDLISHIYILENLNNFKGKITKYHLLGCVLPDYFNLNIKGNEKLVKKSHLVETYIKAFKLKLTEKEKQINLGALIHVLCDGPSHGTPDEVEGVIIKNDVGTNKSYFINKALLITEDVEKAYNVKQGLAIVWGHTIFEFALSYIIIKNNPELKLLDKLKEVSTVDLEVASKYLSKVFNLEEAETLVAIKQTIKILKLLKYSNVKNIVKICSVLGKRFGLVATKSDIKNLIEKSIELLNEGEPYTQFLDQVIKDTDKELIKISF